MIIELSVMCAIIGVVRKFYSIINVFIVLIPTLFLGRIIGIGLIYLMALFMKLPAKFVAGASLLSGWPGVVLMVVAVPSIVRLSRSVGLYPLTGD